MNISEFASKDFKLIRDEWQLLEEAARPRCKNEKEFETIRKAYDFANFAYVNVRRMSGDPYILHPLSVARIIVEEMGLGYKSISAALLHDIIEYTEFTLEDVRNLFGDKIAQLVDGLYKIKIVLDDDAKSNISSIISESIQAENFKRIILSLGDDARVVLIKLADRLHNCRTIEFLPEKKRSRVLSETMYIFIPLAHRLGLYGIKSEMENIWLQYMKPEEYSSISAKISSNLIQREKDIDSFIEPIKRILDERGYVYKIKKRVKSPYSVWKKMCTKNVSFNEIFDLYAVRIIYEPSVPDNIEIERKDAFIIRDLVQELYPNIPERERDWIDSPKSNGYESLHCTLLCKAGFYIEMQIRSHRMDDIAEKGIAAHWTYKKHGYASEADTEMDRWLAKIQGILSSKEIDAVELLDIIQNDLSSHKITVFTPKGEQKSIPTGATALDLAFTIHTHIGSNAIACKVNSTLCPLDTVLKAGDKVEIITAENATPKLEWLQFLHLKTAKAKVIDYFRSRREEISKHGEALYEERLNVMGIDNDKSSFKAIQSFTGISDRAELYYRIGLGIIGPEEFKQAFKPEDKESEAQKSIPSRLSIKGVDKVGLLNEITQCISLSLGINIRKIQISCQNGLFDGFIELSATTIKNLSQLVKDLNRIDGIFEVVRTDTFI